MSIHVGNKIKSLKLRLLTRRFWYKMSRQMSIELPTKWNSWHKDRNANTLCYYLFICRLNNT